MEEERQDYVDIALWITSDQLSPDMITQAVGINPTRIRLRGTSTKTGIMRQPQFDLNEWELGERIYVKEGEYVGNYTECFFTAFLGKLKPLTAKIIQLSERTSISICITYSVREMPYIGLTREQVHAIAALGARVAHDIMVYDS